MPAQQGWRVDVAAGGREGLDRVRAARYDLVLSDIRMPELDGTSFLPVLEKPFAPQALRVGDRVSA